MPGFFLCKNKKQGRKNSGFLNNSVFFCKNSGSNLNKLWGFRDFKVPVHKFHGTQESAQKNILCKNSMRLNSGNHLRRSTLSYLAKNNFAKKNFKLFFLKSLIPWNWRKILELKLYCAKVVFAQNDIAKKVFAEISCMELTLLKILRSNFCESSSQREDYEHLWSGWVEQKCK